MIEQVRKLQLVGGKLKKIIKKLKSDTILSFTPASLEEHSLLILTNTYSFQLKKIRSVNSRFAFTMNEKIQTLILSLKYTLTR